MSCKSYFLPLGLSLAKSSPKGHHFRYNFEQYSSLINKYQHIIKFLRIYDFRFDRRNNNSSILMLYCALQQVVSPFSLYSLSSLKVVPGNNSHYDNQLRLDRNESNNTIMHIAYL